MASGSNYLTTYYAKRIIGDTAAANKLSALLQTGENIASDTWILNRTNRADTYGIKYLFDTTTTVTQPEEEGAEPIETANQHDKIEFYGGQTETVSNVITDVPSAWIQLDTGDLYVLGKVGIGHEPDTYKLYVNGTSYFTNTITIDNGCVNGEVLRIIGAANKVFSFKLSGDQVAGSNIDIGWNWTNVEGAGAAFRSTSFPSQEGEFRIYARKRNSSDVAVYTQLIGTAGETTNGGNLSWGGSASIGADSSEGYKLYVNGTGFFSGGITTRVNGESYVQICDGKHYNDITFRVVLDLNPDNGNHGIWSSGYLNGTTFTSDGKWLLVRSSDGSVQMNGNASTATQVKVTNFGLPSSGSQTNYITLSNSTTTGNQDIKNTSNLYLWENTTTSYLNVGASNVTGAITLHQGTSHVNIIPTTLTANTTRTLTIQNADGTICLTNGTGASGTWGISITGNAATATCATRTGVSVGWHKGRDAVVAKTTTINGYSPTISVKTTSGSWEIGSYNHNDYKDKLIFSYVTDANYNSNTNSHVDFTITTGGYFSGSCASATSATYLKDRTNSTASYLNYGASGLAGSAISWMCCWNGYEVRAISKAETFNVVRDNGGDSRWVNVTGDTMTGALTVTSTGSNRANVNIRSATAVPMDLYLGSNNTNYWSISCRESTDPWLGFYWAGSSAGWALTMRTNKHIEIPVHAYVGGYNNTSYALSTNSFICNSWVRTKGSTGWYNEDYAGGWYMTDVKWIRSFNSKPVLIDIGSNNAYGIGTHRLALGLAGASHVSLMMKGGDVMYGFCVNGDGNWYFGKRTSKSFESTSGDAYCYYGTNTYIYPYTDNAVSLGSSSKRWSVVYGVKVYNAVWNDYAECRQVETEEPGYCVTETQSGIMVKTTTRLQAGCKVTSDTFGTCMGETKIAKTPIAVAGRVLVYPYRAREEYKLGAAVCSAPNGTVDIMTREEIKEYPDRIIGTVSEIPTYEIWSGGAQNGNDDIQVNGRIWIYVR